MWQYRKVTFPSYSAPVSSCITNPYRPSKIPATNISRWAPLKEQLREMVCPPKGIPCVMDNFDWQIFLQALQTGSDEWWSWFFSGHLWRLWNIQEDFNLEVDARMIFFQSRVEGIQPVQKTLLTASKGFIGITQYYTLSHLSRQHILQTTHYNRGEYLTFLYLQQQKQNQEAFSTFYRGLVA